MKRAVATFACSRCGQAFAAAEGLRGHVHSHAEQWREAPYGPFVTAAPATSPVSFICSQCGSIFASAGELRRHAARHLPVATDPVLAADDPARSAEGRTPRPAPAGGRRPARPAASLHSVTTPIGAAVAARRSTKRSARGCAAQTDVRCSRAARTRAARTRRATARRKRGAFAIFAVALILLAATSALAWWSSTTTGSAMISTGTWSTGLAFKAGCSRAAHWDSGRPRLEPIARADENGDFSLDFGDARPNLDCTWCDVLRVTSTDLSPVQLAFTIGGPIAQFVRSVEFAPSPTGTPAGTLEPGQTRRLTMRIVVPKKTPPGVYAGTLTLAVAGSDQRYELPLTITVLSHRPTPSPVPHTPEPTLSPDPLPSGSPSASPSPSGSPTPAAIFTLVPGESTVLPPDGIQDTEPTDLQPTDPAEPPTVAEVLPDGTMDLDFGPLPSGRTIEFGDVLRMTALGDETVQVTITLSESLTELVDHVGFWDEKRGVVDTGLTLKGGEAAHIAFSFALDSAFPTGPQNGTLTLSATLEDGSTQQYELPMTFAIAPAQTAAPTSSPDASESPDPSSLTGPGASP